MTKTGTSAIIFISFFLSLTAAAQIKLRNPESPMSVGSATVSLGIGPGYSHAPYHYDLIGAIKTAIEFGVWHAGPGVITLGGEFGGSNTDNGANIILAGRSAWHYGWHVRGLDTYGGFSLGVRWFLDDSKVYSVDGSNNDDRTYFEPGGFVGVSYFLNRHFGFNAEAGYDISIFQFGIILRPR